jgi:hypothetical protein
MLGSLLKKPVLDNQPAVVTIAHIETTRGMHHE